jgi:beta-lactamase regulating signal transducer with metallopeptidase domain/Tol biopolymer transport system component
MNALSRLFAWVLQASWQASVLILLVLLAQGLFGRWLTARGRAVLWLLVLTRLLLPVSPGSVVSLFNFAKPEAAAPVVVRWFRQEGRQERMPNVLSAGVEAPANPTPSTSEAGPPPATAIARTSTPWPARAEPRRWPLAMGLWGLGGLVLGARLLWRNGRFAWQLRRCREATDPALLDVLAACRAVIAVRRRLRLVETDLVSSPALYGLLRRRLLLPVTMVGRLTREEWRFVLMHELAHLKRWDVTINWLMSLLQIAHWFNPAVWYAFRRVRQDRELACDELVLAKARCQENLAYGEAILKVLEYGSCPGRLPGLVGILETRAQIERRIRTIAKFNINSRSSAPAMVLLAILGLMTLTGAQTEKGRGRSPSTPANADAVVEPETGLKFVAVKTIAGINEVAKDRERITMSPNGKFLLWSGRVVPLDGRPAFALKELQGAGVESWSASWSPDGRKIAFNCEGIEVLPVSPETGRATGPVRVLLEEPGGWWRGRIYWSADSEKILFVKWNRQMERETGSIALRDGRLDKQPDYADFGLLSPDGKTIAYSTPEDGIWAKPVSGGHPRIARARSGGWLFDDPVLWTSDSQWVVSSVDAWMRQEIHFARLSDGRTFDVFPPDTAGRFIGKSTDGRKLWFYRSSFEPRITCKVVPISGGPAFNVGPSVRFEDIEDHFWSSDSGSLAVLGEDQEGHQQLWSVPLAGGDPVRLQIQPVGKDSLWLLLLSPDSKKLLYAASPAADWGTKGLDFYIVPISLRDGRTTGPATLAFKGWRTQSRGAAEKTGAWSPDGTKVAMPHRGDHANELWILSADGGQPVRITQTPHELGSQPQWSPDGREIAFDLIAADREMLQVISAEGGTAKTILTTPKGQLAPFGWSADSKEVVVACDGTIAAFPLTGGSAREIIGLREAGCENASWLGWSPDGRRLAFHGGKRGQPSRLCLFSPRTGKITTLDNSPPEAWDFIWSPDSKMISSTVAEADKTRPAAVIRELDVAEAVKKATPAAERKPPPANANPQAEPIAGPVFTDDFDTGPSRHWRFQDLPDQGFGPGRHAAENGALLLAHARAFLDGIDWTDYIVTVRVCMKESVASGEGLFGIAVRTTPSDFSSDRTDRYGVAVLSSNNIPQSLMLGMFYYYPSDKHGNVLLSESPCSLVRDKWYTLELEARGRKLRGYLDGKLLIEATDGRLVKGGVWLTANKARVLFDDFCVRQLPRTVARSYQ